MARKATDDVGTTIDGSEEPTADREWEPIGDSGGGEDDGIPVVEPSEIITGEASGDASGRRRRGRKPGGRNRTPQQSTKEVSQDLTGLLFSLHLMGAAICKTPELQLTKEEAEELGKAVARVNKEYGIQIISSKAAALINLAIVGGTIYGPRSIAIMNNRKNEKKNSGAKVQVPHATTENDLFSIGAETNRVI